ncbi:hypothetical protein [Paludisphaera mucosa]|uniref:Tail assembly chaperone n=1 Tax=Paludisphaera mucosa TaxID=3030827 RepID=A0ABT6F6Y7_9BACT|nr:hypothetical protein [Paludisphaera mucosa]MDG3003251.1 hypothetical protein [Paludisphaera mucosa]
MNPPTLDSLIDAPALVVEVGGRTYRFSELTLAALGRLQAWIKATCPHPLDALKPHLEGLTAAERRELIADAVEAGRSWPPRIGTNAASELLLGTQEGQLLVLLEGLRAQEPAATDADAEALYSGLTREVKRAAREARAAYVAECAAHAAASEAAEAAGLKPTPPPAPPKFDGDARIGRIYGTLFGTYDPEDEGPKG